MKVQPQRVIPPRWSSSYARSDNVRKGSRMTAPRERRDASDGRQAAPVVRHETRRGCRRGSSYEGKKEAANSRDVNSRKRERTEVNREGNGARHTVKKLAPLFVRSFRYFRTYRHMRERHGTLQAKCQIVATKRFSPRSFRQVPPFFALYFTQTVYYLILSLSLSLFLISFSILTSMCWFVIHELPKSSLILLLPV